MPISRVVCQTCGLAATQIGSGDRAVLSFKVEECVERCTVGIKALEAGEPLAACMIQCEHLMAARSSR